MTESYQKLYFHALQAINDGLAIDSGFYTLQA
jgi:hypothetical protein